MRGAVSQLDHVDRLLTLAYLRMKLAEPLRNDIHALIQSYPESWWRHYHGPDIKDVLRRGGFTDEFYGFPLDSLWTGLTELACQP